jgi:hypothetical protein
MAIYDAHRLIKATLIPQESDNPNWVALIESRADMRLCNHYSHDSSRVIVISAGGGTGDILDESNGSALYSMAEGWEANDMGEDDSSALYDSVKNEWPIITHHGMYNFTEVCVDPDEIRAETLAEIISVAEAFADYPVLDESDYSEREFTAFVAEFDGVSSARLDIESPVAEHPLYIKATEYAMENYYGYSDPGYISSENVKECWIKAGYIFSEDD